jgi:hypothetical protein
MLNFLLFFLMFFVYLPKVIESESRTVCAELLVWASRANAGSAAHRHQNSREGLPSPPSPVAVAAGQFF